MKVPNPTSERQITAEYNRLKEEVDLANKILGELANRTSPLMRQTPIADTPATPLPEVTTPFAQDLRVVYHRVHEVTDTLSYLLSHLEI